ncbi:hypothetical protein NCCP2716_00060 [Sporosarcina sp. NCCP-2716]|uniref:hypothetical protein n=1 Tax=Sporosarcina sp. NCCP-2716 TaxID=2943679 RepID=UPI00203B7518|nr:hypothetical protein [Sporosarcina sp. NCCP-2716]GKV67508.1 hypothetical protein NCCP2716_00060 [Sporosarcina sp. NCCP-2716]
MQHKPLTIVPVTLLPAPNDGLTVVSFNFPGSYRFIRLGHTEVTFKNGFEERIIHSVIWELIHR